MRISVGVHGVPRRWLWLLLPGLLTIGATHVQGVTLQERAPLSLGNPTDDLVRLGVPPPDPWGTDLWMGRLDTLPPDSHAPPPDSASIDQLERYWFHDGSKGFHAKPSEVVWRRLLGYCALRPGELHSLLRYLPDTPEATAAVKRIYNSYPRLRARGRADEYKAIVDYGWDVHDWLMVRGPFFLTDLANRGREAKVSEYGTIPEEPSIRSLARMDWRRGRPILEAHAAGTRPLLRALALSLLYTHASSTRDSREVVLRPRLLAIARDAMADSKARRWVVEALLAGAWKGRDEFYIKLLSDASVMGDRLSSKLLRAAKALVLGVSAAELRRMDGCPEALLGPLQRDPHRYVPMVAALLGRSSAVSHEPAVWCLVELVKKTPRSDALRALLPWLRDAKWSTLDGRDDVIGALAQARVPEATGPLLSLVEAGCACWCSHNPAVATLYAWREPRLAAAIVRRLGGDVSRGEICDLVATLARLQPLSEEKIACAIRAYATATQGDAGGSASDRPPCGDLDQPAAAIVGYAFHRAFARPRGTTRESWWDRGSERIRGTFADPVATRNRVARDLLPTLVTPAPRSASARARLFDILKDWPCHAVDDFLVDQLASGTADAKVVEALLDRRVRLRQGSLDRLRTLAKQSGWIGGVATALLGEPSAHEALAGGNDVRAVRAFFAAMRSTREGIAVPTLRRFDAHQAPAVHAVIVAYLVDTQHTTVQEIAAVARGHLPIIGGDRVPFAGSWITGNAGFEDRLRAMVRAPGGPGEVFGFAAGFNLWGFGRPDRVVVLAVYAPGARLICEGADGHAFERRVGPAELQTFRDFIARERIDDLPPYSQTGGGDWQSEYVHLRRDGGRRVTMTYERSCVIRHEPPNVYD